jgi:hypothetical protein
MHLLHCPWWGLHVGTLTPGRWCPKACAQLPHKDGKSYPIDQRSEFGVKEELGAGSPKRYPAQASYYLLESQLRTYIAVGEALSFKLLYQPSSSVVIPICGPSWP